MSSNIPSKMKACQVTEFNKPYTIHQIDTPSPSDLAPQDLLVKVAVASLCHTDAMVSAGIMGTHLPCTASHEGSGTVVAIGSGVQDFKVGDRVMVGLPYHFCGTCEHCQGPENYRQYCRQRSGAIGITRNGCFADYVQCDSTTTAKLPDEVSFETAAPMACAGCSIFRGVLQANLKAGEWLGIVGSGGGLGHLGIQFAKAFGLKIVAVDARDEGLELSKAYLGGGGGEELHGVVVDARANDAVEQVKKVTGGQGVAATINVSDAKTAAATSCAITKMHGLVVQIAQPDDVCIPFRELVFRNIRVQGSLICSPAEARQMLDIVAKHKITVASNSFDGIDKVPELLELAHGGKMKGKGYIIVDPKQIEEEKKLAKEQA